MHQVTDPGKYTYQKHNRTENSYVENPQDQRTYKK